jgi:hypothetical protein
VWQDIEKTIFAYADAIIKRQPSPKIVEDDDDNNIVLSEAVGKWIKTT